MSAQIDVLAVMNRACTTLNDEGLFNPGDDLCKARAAVAELIAALRIAVRQNSHDMLMTGEELRLCELALANTGGAK